MKFIVNPIDKTKYLVNSLKGKELLKNYIKQLQKTKGGIDNETLYMISDIKKQIENTFNEFSELKNQLMKSELDELLNIFNPNKQTEIGNRIRNFVNLIITKNYYGEEGIENLQEIYTNNIKKTFYNLIIPVMKTVNSLKTMKKIFDHYLLCNYLCYQLLIYLLLHLMIQ